PGATRRDPRTAATRLRGAAAGRARLRSGPDDRRLPHAARVFGIVRVEHGPDDTARLGLCRQRTGRLAARGGLHRAILPVGSTTHAACLDVGAKALHLNNQLARWARLWQTRLTMWRWRW